MWVSPWGAVKVSHCRRGKTNDLHGGVLYTNIKVLLSFYGDEEKKILTLNVKIMVRTVVLSINLSKNALWLNLFLYCLAHILCFIGIT